MSLSAFAMDHGDHAEPATTVESESTEGTIKNKKMVEGEEQEEESTTSEY